MARSDAVWGIDIGNCSLKALRCRPGSQDDQVVADAFDYIEYPKLLTQPGAEPAELIADALKQFQSRNSVRGDRVAISVSGQNGLARFIKLPPVEAKKIPDIVRYEAKQQIPFDLEDVVWDYQRMGGGSEEEGFALETEIGLFAMKRDQVFRALEPFRNAGIEVDFVQLSPLTLYNYLVFDQLSDLPPIDEYDPENPPPSIVVLSMGTDATDLVVTNGYRVWQRSVPLGGNHFTKALTKELKLTFAKAEHLKRNATTAQDPKAVFQAMRPVFNDLLTEIQRSIGFFTSIDRHAKIEKVVGLGNAMKLPGLRRYLSQSLGFEVVRLDEFRGLEGSDVVDAPAFRENLLCFGVPYGLAVQGLNKGALRTNLLPKELVKDRIIKEKKPWALAAAAVLLLACTISFVSLSRALGTVAESRFQNVEGELVRVKSDADGFASDYGKLQEEFQRYEKTGKNLVGNVEGRLLWLELMKVVNECLPSDEGEIPEEIMQRRQLHITNIECVRYDKLEQWFAAMKERDWYQPPEGAEGEGTGAAGAAEAAEGEAPPADAAAAGGTPGATAGDAAGAEGEPREGPQGEGFIVAITGYHYRNFRQAGPDQGAEFVRNTLIRNLNSKQFFLPVGYVPAEEKGPAEADAAAEEEPAAPKKTGDLVTASDLGIGYPVLVDPRNVRDVEIVNPYATAEGEAGVPGGEGMGMMMGELEGPMGMGPGMGGPRPGAAGTGETGPEKIPLRRFDFVVHFVWQPVTPTERQAKKALEEGEQAEAEAEL